MPAIIPITWITSARATEPGTLLRTHRHTNLKKLISEVCPIEPGTLSSNAQIINCWATEVV